MDFQTLTVLVGGDAMFRLLPGGMVVMPTNEKERAEVVGALRSALDCFEPLTPRASLRAMECGQD